MTHYTRTQLGRALTQAKIAGDDTKLKAIKAEIVRRVAHLPR